MLMLQFLFGIALGSLLVSVSRSKQDPFEFPHEKISLSGQSYEKILFRTHRKLTPVYISVRATKPVKVILTSPMLSNAVIQNQPAWKRYERWGECVYRIEDHLWADEWCLMIINESKEPLEAHYSLAY